jgi:hypothetical protein
MPKFEKYKVLSLLELIIKKNSQLAKVDYSNNGNFALEGFKYNF